MRKGRAARRGGEVGAEMKIQPMGFDFFAERAQLIGGGRRVIE